MSEEGSSCCRKGLLWPAVALALGLIVSAAVVSKTAERIKLSHQTITVKGFAQQRIVSDRAVWRGTFVVRGAEMVGAYKRLEKDLETVLAYLEKQGFARDQVAVLPAHPMTQYKQVRNRDGDLEPTNEIAGYVLDQSVEISSDRVELVGRIARESAGLIREGVEFNSQAPQYFYTKADELKIKMIGEATRDAKARAEQLAVNSGSRVGALRSASQGVFQITPLYSTEVTNEGQNDTSSLDKSIKAVVTIDYAIR